MGRVKNASRRRVIRWTLTCAGVVSIALSMGIARPALAVGGKDASWVAQRVAAWQPTEDEKRWQTIGWAGSILEAERLAKAHRRPVFLFTHDGRLNVGRC